MREHDEAKSKSGDQGGDATVCGEDALCDVHDDVMVDCWLCLIEVK
jgi:hypothetical protein